MTALNYCASGYCCKSRSKTNNFQSCEEVAISTADEGIFEDKTDNVY